MTPSPLLALVLALGLVGLTASPAAADDTAADGAGRILVGALVGAGGAAAGTLAGIGLARASRSPELALMVLLPTSNLVTGLALETYGAATGHDGSALAASAASLGAQALGATVAFSGAGSDLTTVILTTVVAQGVLASVVYALTSEDEPAAGAQSGALLRYHPAQGFAIGAPCGVVAADAEGGFTVGLTVAAGQF